MRHVINNFPILRQAYNYDCGAVAVQSVLDYSGIDIREGKLLKIEGTDKHGTYVKGVKKALRYFGLNYKEGKMDINTLKRYVDKKIPTIITIQAWANKKTELKKDWKDGHYVVVIGYSKNKVYFEDPSAEKMTYLSFKELEERWHDVDLKGKHLKNWGLAVFRPKYSKNPHKKICRDYKKYGKKYMYNKNQAIHMG